MARVLVVDNYDSFTMNLVQPLRALGLPVIVRRNDALSVDELDALAPTHIILSPGPNRPEQAGVCLELVAAAAAAGLPLLGICLGHQCLAQAFGGRVVEAAHPLHGRATRVRHDGQGVLRGLPNPLRAARYHSLAVAADALPDVLVATAWDEDGTLMGLRHRELPLEGLQFHPESYLTEAGERILRRFVALAEAPAVHSRSMDSDLVPPAAFESADLEPAAVDPKDLAPGPPPSDAPREELLAENEFLREQLAAVTDIGIALSAERDLTSLLETVLTKARWLTRADAGSIYLVEGDKRDKLRFAFAQNDSINVPFVEMVLDVSSKTIVGYATRSKQTIRLEDVYQLPAGAEYSFSTRFDESVGYRCKSMLVIPMIDHRDRVIGCLQLINCKPERELRLADPAQAEREVIPFPDTSVRLMEALASQSAVAIDKARLIDDLEQTFEGLVFASVIAIESRDPTTKGHSERVARLSVELAKAVSDVGHGKFAGVRFSGDQLKELRYASLLHDFGKVGVREHVLVKAKKVYPWDLENIRLRFAVAMKEREAQVLRDVVRKVAAVGGSVDPTPFVDAAEETIAAETKRLMTMYQAFLKANEPKVLADGAEEQLHHIASEAYTDLDGCRQPLLTGLEVGNLAIPRGSLNREERAEIESHVEHTYRFLVRIPWTGALRELPRIAGAHHEKLDGSGYPHGLVDEEIPPQAKIMSVADIFDALTALDRPYKKAVPLERALAILQAEVDARHLEQQLVDLFRERKLYRFVLTGT